MFKMYPALLILTSIAFQNAVAKSRVYMCYYGTYTGEYESLDYFLPLELCTHVIHYYGRFENVANSPTLKLSNEIVRNGSANENLKAQRPDVKFLISIIGIPSFIGDSEKRSKLILEMQSFLSSSNMDGIDIQLKTTYHPCAEIELPGDAQFFAKDLDLFLEDLREAFPNKVLILTLESNPTSSSLNFQNVMRFVNFINLQAYIMCMYSKNHGTGFHAPIYALNDDFSVDSKVRHLLNLGVRKTKLVVSILAGAQYFYLLDSTNNGLGAPMLSSRTLARFGEKTHYEICGIREKHGSSWTLRYDAFAHSSYLLYKIDETSRIRTLDTVWVSSDFLQDTVDKGLYVSSMRLAGISLYGFEKFSNASAEPLCRDFTAFEALKEALRVCPKLAAADLTYSVPIKP